MLRCGGDRVVVVGGGIAGALLAKTLQNHADVVLIDPKEYFEIPWANLRAKVNPHADYLTHAKVVTASAVGIDDSVILTSIGRVVTCDFLVVATGRLCYRPQRRRDRLEMFQEDSQTIKSSASILIIGGGPAGVELAAEIAMDSPEKRVTLVHDRPRLLEVMGSKASNKALDWLRSKNVAVLLDQSVDLGAVSDADTVFTTTAGETVVAHCCFMWAGRPLASGWLRESFLKGYIDRSGRLMVDENLRVGGLKNVFAIGDITNIPEAKQGYLVQQHAMVVSRNLKLLIKGAGEHKLHRYKASSSAITVTLGRRDALSELPFMTIVGHLPGMIKSTRRLMGLRSTV